ncbi:RNA-binding protein 42-like isoform X2 [Oncorhynchus keta]|uniref:RNA-binding protein 42-like isoform X2 n=1 Tax=Oncorhynchus keta TaxID=8018 RepID=UPI00227D350A|nr:RNA-binding protein 42-like isoform X2 [Oncorhynchus keta]
MAMKSGEERLKEMEAEMALFEQEVLGGQVAMTAGDPVVMELLPMGVPMTVPMIRPIIGTNTYRQVQQTLDARAATFVGPPPPAFVGPAITPGVRPPPMMRPAFMPHILQRPGPRMPVMSGPPPQGMMAPPLPRPPPPPPMMMAPPMQGPPQHPQHPMDPMGHMSSVGPPVGSTHGTPMGHSMVSAPSRSVTQAPPKLTPSIISAAPTVYTAPSGPKIPDIHAQRKARMEELAASVAEQQAAVMAAGLLEAKKEASLAASDDNVIGPSMPEPEPVHTEPADSTTEEKKKGKQEKAKKCIRTAAGTSWEDQSLLEWDSASHLIFSIQMISESSVETLAMR